MHLLVNKNPHFQNNDNGKSERKLLRIVAKEKVLIRAKALEKEGDVGPSPDATLTR